MRTCQNTEWVTTRRGLLQRTAVGFGWLAFSALNASAESRGSPLSPKPPHFEPRAKRVIFLFMEGGPSHLDTFDWKPELAKAGNTGRSRLLAPVFEFQPHGQSGLMLSTAFPHLAKHADTLCVLNGMRTNNPGHQQAIVALHTGNETFVRPSVGAWVTYGLGTLAEDLPGFITIDPIAHPGGAQNYGSAFLPATFQGTALTSGSRSLPNLTNGRLSDADQRRQLAFLQTLNRRVLVDNPGHPEIEGLVES